MWNQVRTVDTLTRLLGPHPCSDEDTSKIPDVSIVEASAELLYGLIHQRFIITRVGLQAMVSRFRIRHPSCSAHVPIDRQVREWFVWVVSTRLLQGHTCGPVWEV